MSTSAKYESGIEQRARQLNAFQNELEDDTLMEISIGKNGRSLKVPRSTLVSIFHDFVKAVKHQALGNVRPGTLSFPEDDLDAWVLFLQWKKEKALPAYSQGIVEGEFTLHLRSWVLGDKYGVTEFQNAVMLEILDYVTRNWTELKHAEMTFHSTLPGSALRKLVAEETAYSFREKRWRPPISTYLKVQTA